MFLDCSAKHGENDLTMSNSFIEIIAYSVTSSCALIEQFLYNQTAHVSNLPAAYNTVVFAD